MTDRRRAPRGRKALPRQSAYGGSLNARRFVMPCFGCRNLVRVIGGDAVGGEVERGFQIFVYGIIGFGELVRGDF